MPRSIPSREESVRLFWARVEKTGGCWLFRHNIRTDGYGEMRFGGERAKSHRLAWVLAHGAIPAGMHVLHRCDVRACVRPEHLFLGSHAENMRDCTTKGRRAKGEAHGRARMTADHVRRIRVLLAEGMPIRDVAWLLGVGHRAVSEVSSGRTWKHVT